MENRIYRLPQVIELTGLSRSYIYLAIGKNEFPKPIKLGRRAIGWPQKSIDDWKKKIEGGFYENIKG